LLQQLYCLHPLADGNERLWITEKVLEFSSTVLPTPSPYHIFTRCQLLLLLLLLHPFNGLFPRTTWVNRHQKGEPFWILLKQEMMGWQWHQLDHMQIICTLVQTDNHASTSPLSFYRPDDLPDAQPTASMKKITSRMKLAAMLRGSRPGVQSASLIMMS